MKIAVIAAAACLALGAPAVAFAASSPGASQYAPGQKMQKKGAPNASSYAPGQVKKHKGSRSAAEYSPGDRKNDHRKMQ